MTDGEYIRAGFMVFFGVWLGLLPVVVGIALGAVIIKVLS